MCRLKRKILAYTRCAINRQIAHTITHDPQAGQRILFHALTACKPCGNIETWRQQTRQTAPAHDGKQAQKNNRGFAPRLSFMLCTLIKCDMLFLFCFRFCKYLLSDRQPVFAPCKVYHRNNSQAAQIPGLS